MFIDINSEKINKLLVASISKADEILDGSTVYKILYVMSSGIKLEEEFNTVSERDTKYDSI